MRINLLRKGKNTSKEFKMDIRCRKTTCEFNNNHTCIAKEITIDKKICCASYVLAEEIRGVENDKQGTGNHKKVIDTTKGMSDKDVVNLKTEDYSKKMFKKPQKNAPFRNRKTINIDCKADCLFNENGICRANGITVNDMGEPVCMGYLPK